MRVKVSDAVVVETLKRFNGNKTQAASALGLNLRSFIRRVQGLEQRGLVVTGEGKPRAEYTLPDGEIIVFSDAHFYPGVDIPAFIGLLQVIDKLKHKAVSCNGYAFGGACFSLPSR